MEKPPEQSREAAYLDDFATLAAAISEYVQTEYLLPHQMPHWGWPEEQPLPFGRVGKWLHRLYARQDRYVFVFPTRFVLTFGLLFSLISEMLYPRVISLISDVSIFSIRLSWQTLGPLVLIFVLLLLLLLLPLFSALGAYWTLFELGRNRLLARRLRVIVILIAVGIVVLWCANGGVRLSDKMNYDDSPIDQTALAIQQSSVYLILSALLFYIPVLSHLGLWVTRSIAAIAFGVGSALYWFLSFHVVRPIEMISEFLETPLPMGEEKPQTLLQLEQTQIDALHDWSLCRRQAIQNRLVPTTLILAFLSLLANTSLGESAIQTVIHVSRDYFQDVGSLSWLVTSWRFFLLVAIILLPGILVFLLMNEAFTMDFIAQACLLAHHAKMSGVDEPVTRDHHEERSGLFSRLGRWIDRLIRLIRRRENR